MFINHFKSKLEFSYFSTEIESSLMRLIDKVSDGIIILDNNWNILYLNQVFEKIFDQKRKDIIGKNLWLLMPQLVGKKLYRESSIVQKNHKKRHFEFYSDVFHKWFNTTISFSKDKLIIYLKDIDKQKKVELETKNYIIFLKSIIEQMPVGVVVVQAPKGNIILKNKELEKIFRTPVKDISRLEEYKTWEGYRVKNNQQYKPNEWPLARSLLRGEIVKGEEIKIIRKDGSVSYVRIRSSPIKNDEGQVVAGVAIDNEVTEIKEIERKKDEFISMASHELKTPVTTIKIFSQILKKSLASSDYKNAPTYVRKMSDQIVKLEKLVNNLLDVSRIQSKDLKLNKRYFSLNKLVKEVGDTIKITDAFHKIIISNIDKIIVYGDKDRIGEVLINLLNNAIKYSPSVPEIRIYIQKINKMAVVNVEDSGIGIEKEHQGKIFQRLYRVYDKKDKTFPGLGVGLFISFEIIRLHKGTLTVESEPGAGSIFTFTLPLIRKNSSHIK